MHRKSQEGNLHLIPLFLIVLLVVIFWDYISKYLNP